MLLTYLVTALWKSVSCLCVAVTAPPLLDVGNAFNVVSNQRQNVFKRRKLALSFKTINFFNNKYVKLLETKIKSKGILLIMLFFQFLKITSIHTGLSIFINSNITSPKSVVMKVGRQNIQALIRACTRACPWSFRRAFTAFCLRGKSSFSW